MLELGPLIRDVPDFPKKGILFKDITTLLKNPAAFKQSIDQLTDLVRGLDPGMVIGMESRGFIFAAPIAYQLGAGFVPVRKPKKLPWKAVAVTYQLEYGTDTLEIHQDAIKPGQRVLISDDLLATGGTAAATAELVRKLGGVVVGASFAVELTFLNGRAKLPGIDVFTMIQYDK